MCVNNDNMVNIRVNHNTNNNMSYVPTGDLVKYSEWRIAPKVAIYSNYTILFSCAAIERYNTEKNDYVSLYYDIKKKTIAFDFTKNKERLSYTLCDFSYGRFAIRAIGFINHYGLWSDRPRTFIIKDNNVNPLPFIKVNHEMIGTRKGVTNE